MKRWKMILLAVTFSLFSFMTATPAFAENIDVEVTPDEVSRSIKRDYLMGVFSKKLMSPSNQRAKINTEIVEGTSKKYSLFDRFGGDIYFDMYMGEDRCYINLGDKIYTHMLKNPSKQDDPTGIKGVADILSLKDGNFTTRYYNGRPDLKTEEGDPRVKVYMNHNNSKISKAMDLGSSNFNLTLSKWINRVVAYLSSNKLLTQIKDLSIDYVSSPRYRDVEKYVRTFVPLILSGTVIYIVGRALKIAKGSYSPKEFIISLVSAICSFGLVFVLLGQPKGFILANYKILSFGDTVSSEILNKKAEKEDNEIVTSDIPDNVVEATLWDKSIFRPWVRAEFGGLDYDKLYTQASKKPNPYRLHEEETIGEISVPRSGKGETVKNWGALLYSVNSPYHLPAIKEERETLVKTTKDELGNYRFPLAPFAGLSPSIYEDDFRVIDADTKVGQVENEDISEVAPYINYRNYQFDGLKESFVMLFLSILLIPIGFLGLKKIEYAVRAIYGFATVAFKSIMNVAFPGETSYSFSKNVTRGFFLPLMNYWFYTLLTVVVILLYTSFAGTNFVSSIFYIAISWYICVYVKPGNLINVEINKTNLKNYFQKMARDTRSSFIEAQDYVKDGSSLNEILSESREKDRKDMNRFEETGCRCELKPNAVIRKETYLEGLGKRSMRKREEDIYRDLQDKLVSAFTYGEIYDAIQEHRARHRELDRVILGIPENQNASIEYYEKGKEINPDYNSYDDVKTDVSNSTFSRFSKYEVDRLRTAYDYINKEDLSKEDYNRHLKDIKDEAERLSKECRFDGAQRLVNAATGKRRGGSYVSLKTKIKLVAVVSLVYVVAFFISAFIGV